MLHPFAIPEQGAGEGASYGLRATNGGYRLCGLTDILSIKRGKTMLPKGQYLKTSRELDRVFITLKPDLNADGELELTTSELDQFLQHVMETRLILKPPVR